MMAGLVVGWMRSDRNRRSAGWARRMRLSIVISGVRVPGRSKSAVRISYFSESRYSSLVSEAGPVLVQLVSAVYAVGRHSSRGEHQTECECRRQARSAKGRTGCRGCWARGWVSCSRRARPCARSSK